MDITNSIHVYNNTRAMAVAMLAAFPSCYKLTSALGPDKRSLLGRLRFASSHPQQRAGAYHTSCRAPRVWSMATEAVEVLVKAANGNPSQLGDCPFSQRVLLTLEEKGIPYESKFVDMDNKPEWFLEVNPEGKVPVVKDNGKWVADSDVIAQLIENKYPVPSLATPSDKAKIGSTIFPSFVKFLKSKDPNDGTESALLEELKALDDYLKANGPYINGENISAVDLSLAPKLYHLKVALGHYKQWSIPDDLKHLHSYMEALFSRESFHKTKAPEDVMLRGWAKHLAK